MGQHKFQAFVNYQVWEDYFQWIHKVMCNMFMWGLQSAKLGLATVKFTPCSAPCRCRTRCLASAQDVSCEQALASALMRRTGGYLQTVGGPWAMEGCPLDTSTGGDLWRCTHQGGASHQASSCCPRACHDWASRCCGHGQMTLVTQTSGPAQDEHLLRRRLDHVASALGGPSCRACKAPRPQAQGLQNWQLGAARCWHA
eukprot:366318-Chlamydomonas_euryale.AAC.4